MDPWGLRGPEMTTTAVATTAVATVAELGIGARFSIHPHCDDFVRVILDALREVEEAGLTEGLVIETDEVSTYVGARQAPGEERLARYLSAVVAAASRHGDGGHVVAHVLLSRGCPGEMSCDLTHTALPQPEPVRVGPTGVMAAAQWSLYPLLDGGAGGGNHMAVIEAAIARAQERGTASGAAHYATRLDGDVAEVLATAVDTWASVGTEVPHVVTHLTVSVGSPTPGARA